MKNRPLALLLAVVLAGCAGADEQLVEKAQGDAGDSLSAPSLPSSSGGSATTPSGGADASTGSSGQPTTGQGSDAGAGTVDQGGGIDAGVAPLACPAGGTMQEANGNSASSPTDFDTVACGTLAAHESYFWTFRLPQSTQSFGMNFTGGLDIQLTLDGKTVNVVPGASLPFRTRDPYLLQITPAGNTTEAYVLEVVEK